MVFKNPDSLPCICKLLKRNLDLTLVYLFYFFLTLVKRGQIISLGSNAVENYKTTIDLLNEDVNWSCFGTPYNLINSWNLEQLSNNPTRYIYTIFWIAFCLSLPALLNTEFVMPTTQKKNLKFDFKLYA